MKYKFKRGQIVKATCDYCECIRQGITYVVSRRSKNKYGQTYVTVLDDNNYAITLDEALFTEIK